MFVKAKWRLMELLGPTRLAKNSVRRLPSLTMDLCSLGFDGVSGGNDDVKFHSSSSFDTAGFGGGGVLDAAREANGSTAG